MPRGHAIILNMSSYLPFVFHFNPETINTEKKINYVVAPNIGGAYKKRYFAGFDSKEVSFDIQVIDMQNPLGVTAEISYFEQLRQPDPGLFDLANSFWNNENFPPPQILFQFGVAYIPLVWDVLDITIEKSHFFDDHVRGIIGIPKRAKIGISLSLDEDDTLNKANQIAEKAGYIAGFALSITKEVLHKTGKRKEAPWSKYGSLQG